MTYEDYQKIIKQFQQVLKEAEASDNIEKMFAPLREQLEQLQEKYEHSMQIQNSMKPLTLTVREEEDTF